MATAYAEGSILPLTPLRTAVLLGLVLLPAGWLYPFLRFVERRSSREAAVAALPFLFPVLVLIPIKVTVAVLRWSPLPLLPWRLYLFLRRVRKTPVRQAAALALGLAPLVLLVVAMLWTWRTSWRISQRRRCFEVVQAEVVR